MSKKLSEDKDSVDQTFEEWLNTETKLQHPDLFYAAINKTSIVPEQSSMIAQADSWTDAEVHQNESDQQPSDPAQLNQSCSRPCNPFTVIPRNTLFPIDQNLSDSQAFIPIPSCPTLFGPIEENPRSQQTSIAIHQNPRWGVQRRPRPLNPVAQNPSHPRPGNPVAQKLSRLRSFNPNFQTPSRKQPLNPATQNPSCPVNMIQNSSGSQPLDSAVQRRHRPAILRRRSQSQTTPYSDYKCLRGTQEFGLLKANATLNYNQLTTSDETALGKQCTSKSRSETSPIEVKTQTSSSQEPSETSSSNNDNECLEYEEHCYWDDEEGKMVSYRIAKTGQKNKKEEKQSDEDCKANAEETLKKPDPAYDMTSLSDAIEECERSLNHMISDNVLQETKPKENKPFLKLKPRTEEDTDSDQKDSNDDQRSPVTCRRNERENTSKDRRRKKNRRGKTKPWSFIHLGANTTMIRWPPPPIFSDSEGDGSETDSSYDEACDFETYVTTCDTCACSVEDRIVYK